MYLDKTRAVDQMAQAQAWPGRKGYSHFDVNKTGSQLKIRQSRISAKEVWTLTKYDTVCKKPEDHKKK